MLEYLARRSRTAVTPVDNPVSGPYSTRAARSLTASATTPKPYIRAAQAAASELSSLLDQALTRGDLRLEELFDEQYRPLQGTQPPQFVTRYCGLADQLLPQVQERMLGLSSQVVICVAIDRNGYIACHNRKYNQPQRAGDVVWNTANCRNRRLFQDRAGLAAGGKPAPLPAADLPARHGRRGEGGDEGGGCAHHGGRPPLGRPAPGLEVLTVLLTSRLRAF
jgi:hypothetical protein